MQARDSREDVFIGGMLAQYGVHCADTRDVNNAWRYRPLDATSINANNNLLAGRVDVFKRKFEAESGEGMNSISEQSVSFHLKYHSFAHWLAVEDEMEIYHMILYGLCDQNISDAQ